MPRFEPFDRKDLSILDKFSPPGWGDLVPRFEYFIDSEHCYPVKMLVDNDVTGIGTNILHADSAWLACIIVHGDHRNKGYGQRLTQYLVDHTHQLNIPTIYLEATDFGYPVYAKLGFVTEANYYHYKPRRYLDNPPESTIICSFNEQYRDQMLELDRSISGEDRRSSFEGHFEESQIFIEENKVIGFYMPTLGDGLIIAESKKAGVELMKSRLRDRAYATLPANNKVGIDLLLEHGLEQIRVSRRMRLGEERPLKLEKMYNRISGQLG
jgi:GNAT superfamily N-acetyltransferase